MYIIRIIEVVMKFEIHTFPIVLSFVIVVFCEFVIIKIMPKVVLCTFGK